MHEAAQGASQAASTPAAPPETFTLTPASAADRGQAARVLAAAFAREPHTIGMLPENRRPARLRVLFARLFDETMTAGGHAFLAREDEEGPALGAALWMAPGTLPSFLSVAAGFPSYLRVFGRRLPDAIRGDRLIRAHRPRAPHWYLLGIGTTEHARGRGIASALLETGTRAADREGVGCYLEASPVSSVLALYRKHGFIPRGPIPAAGTAPAIGMWRAPAEPVSTRKAP